MRLKDKVKATSLVDYIGGTYFGNEMLLIDGINEIHKVQEGDITFVDHPKYYSKALNSAASLILINKEVEIPEGKGIIVLEDPFVAYNQLVNKYYQFKKSDSLIADSAQIGEGTIIQPGSFVGNNVKIGRNCLIHSNVSIYDNVEIGNNVIIHANSSLGADAFYFQKRNGAYSKLMSCGNVIVADDVEIGAGCTIDKGVSGLTKIGKGTKLDNQVHIAHGAVIGANCLFAAQTTIAGKTIIEDDVILWGQVGVDKNLVLGKGCMVLAQSGVTRNLEPGKTYLGFPAQEARTQLKEQASLRKLPDLIKKWR